MSRIVLWLVNGALFVLCAFLAAEVVNAVLAHWLSASPAEIAQPPPAPEPVARSLADREVILQKNLFQVSTLQPEATEPVEPQEDLEETKLPVRLLGTAAASDPAHSWAAVEDLQNRQQLVVRVDDTLLEDATVIRIERRRIVIRNGARQEQLSLDEEDGGPSTAAAAPAAARVAARSPARPAAVDRLRERVRQLAEDRFEVERAEVQEAVRNPAELFSQARILPKYEDGQMVGVQLNSIQPGSLFEEIGIQNGDTITEVNGIVVASPQDSAELLRELSESTEFEVSVVGNDGQSRTLSYVVGE